MIRRKGSHGEFYGCSNYPALNIHNVNNKLGNFKKLGV
jgi:ssDNA-binding Zn-finger/Zn-ribbon topoisomerase 1